MMEFRVTINNAEGVLLTVSGPVVPASVLIDSAGKSPRRYDLYHASDDPADPDTEPLERVDLEGTKPSRRRYVTAHRKNHHSDDRR